MKQQSQSRKYFRDMPAGNRFCADKAVSSCDHHSDPASRFSKIGDRSDRTVLYEAANIILTKPVKAGALKS